MRKIVLLMSIICLTAMAAGCEENGMVVLMGNGADVSASEDACAKCGANQICMDGECKERPGNSDDECVNGMCKKSEGASCASDDICIDGLVCKERKCVKKQEAGCIEGEECENGKVCKGGVCVDVDDPESVCNNDNDCGKDKVCRGGECLNLCKPNEDCSYGKCVCRDKEVCNANNRCENTATTGQAPKPSEACEPDGSCKDKNKVCEAGKCRNTNDGLCDNGMVKCDNNIILLCDKNNWKIMNSVCGWKLYYTCYEGTIVEHQCDVGACVQYDNKGECGMINIRHENDVCEIGIFSRESEMRCSINGEQVLRCECTGDGCLWKVQDSCDVGKGEYCHNRVIGEEDIYSCQYIGS